jgi:hypothetical protein
MEEKQGHLVRKAFLSAVLTCLWAVISASDAYANIGRIKNTTGSVTIERGVEKIEAKPGVVLQQGDTIITGPDGRVGITFIDNTRFAVASLSSFAIDRFDYNDTTYSGEFITSLNKGTLGIVTGRISRYGPQAMRIKMGNSLMVIQGGRLVVKAP